MSKRVEDVLRQAMGMTPAERAALVERLVASLEPTSDESVEAAWQEEASRRLREVRPGGVTLVPWESIRDRLRGQTRASS